MLLMLFGTCGDARNKERVQGAGNLTASNFYAAYSYC